MTLLTSPQFSPLALAFGIPGGYEWIILLVIALLIFGRRLPEVGRWLGQGIVEFKKGVKGISDEIDEASGEKGSPDRIADQSRPSSSASESSQREQQTVPRSDQPSEEKHHLDR